MLKKRTITEMWDLIKKFVHDHQEIIAVGTEGSFNNPNTIADQFQDIDVSFFVAGEDDRKKFIDLDYEQIFGEFLVATKEIGELIGKKDFIRMMQFTDGNRIDLKVLLISQIDDYLQADNLNTLVWGGESRKTDDSTFWVKKPTQKELDACINEFYWVSLYVLKGIKRRNLIYANATFELIRQEYFRLVAWNHFVRRNPGKFYANLGKVISVERLYDLGNLAKTKQALGYLLEQFRLELKQVPESGLKTERYIKTQLEEEE